jgi:spore coat polysaccharide biosynthesis protein SpsF (cytidylyltransferase family)
LKQLDLFRKTKRISESMAKYKRTPDRKMSEAQYRSEGLMRVDIYCQCKRYLKVYYELREPAKEHKSWTVPSIEDYKKGLNIDEFFCPHCSGKLYIMGAKVKIIEV